MRPRLLRDDSESDHRAAPDARAFTRRQFLAAGFGLGAAIPLTTLLAACGDDDESPIPTPDTNGAGPTATTVSTGSSGEIATSSDTNHYPITIDHKFGQTTIPAEPLRVVSVGYRDHEHLLSLGVVPVAVRDWYGDYPFATWPWAQDALADAQPTVLEAGELDFELIATLEPDVIIGIYSGMTEVEYSTLRDIAPTVPQSGEYLDWTMPWQEESRMIGRVVGRPELAEELIAGIEERFAAVRAAHPEFAGKTAVMTQFGEPGQFYILNPEDHKSRFLTSLGFSIPEEVANAVGEQSNNLVSFEQFHLLDQDLLVWLLGIPNWEGRDAAVSSVIENDIYRRLPVVQDGRAVLLEGAADALSWATPLSLTYAIDEAVPIFADLFDDEVSGDNGPFPVAITHKFGLVNIPEAPQRVVTIGFSEQDPVLALGVTPIAIRDWFGDQPFAVWPWSQDALGDAEPEVLTMPFGELDFEVIAGLKPDLIVATHSGILAEEYDTLSRIAPTLAQSDKYPDFGVPWQEQTRLIGRALGLEPEADALVAQAEQDIADVAIAHPEYAGATVAWISPADGGGYWATGPTTPPMRFLAELGFEMPDELAGEIGDLDSIQISGEQLGLIDVDVLIVQATSEVLRDEIQSDPLFQQLRVLQEGRAIFFSALDNPTYGALSFSTILSLPYAVEHLTPQLVAAVDGDPDMEAT